MEEGSCLEEGSVEGGGHEDEAQLGVCRQQVPQGDEQEVSKAIALMNLIDNNVGQVLHALPGRQLAQQHAVRAEDQRRGGVASASPPPFLSLSPSAH